MSKISNFRSTLGRALIAGSAAVASLALPGAAQAVVTVVGPVVAGQDSCTNFTFSVAIISCAGGYGGNLLQGSVTNSNDLAALVALGAPNTGTFVGPKLEGLNAVTGVIDFSTLMTGISVFGIHAGGAGGTNSTFFFRFDAGAGVDVITITGRAGANNSGLSNSALFATGGVGAVPEPSTWAMMLIGFGAVGFSMRRRRATFVQAA